MSSQIEQGRVDRAIGEQFSSGAFEVTATFTERIRLPDSQLIGLERVSDSLFAIARRLKLVVPLTNPYTGREFYRTVSNGKIRVEQVFQSKIEARSQQERSATDDRVDKVIDLAAAIAYVIDYMRSDFPSQQRKAQWFYTACWRIMIKSKKNIVDQVRILTQDYQIDANSFDTYQRETNAVNWIGLFRLVTRNFNEASQNCQFDAEIERILKRG